MDTNAAPTRDEVLFLLRASEVLSASLDYEFTLQQVAKLAVSRVADWCRITLRTDEGTFEHVASAHANPEKAALVEELHRRYPTDLQERSGTAQALRTGRPVLVPDLGDAWKRQAAHDEAHFELLREIGARSAMLLPLAARGSTFGALTLVISESDRRYQESNLPFAVDLARRMAIAIDNARLYRASERSGSARSPAPRGRSTA